MAKNGGNKAKGRQSSRGKQYYEAQYFRTTANKLRREKARTRKFARLKAKREAAAPRAHA